MKSLFKRKKIMIAVVLVAILSAWGFMTASGTTKMQEQPVVTSGISVDVQPVMQTNTLSNLHYKANLEPVEEADVSSNVSGKVTKVLFENGDQVTKGQVLAYLDDVDLQNRLSTAKLELSKLQSDLSLKERRYKNAKVLYESGACSKNDYDDAELNYKAAVSDSELKNVEIQNINHSIDNSVIKAEISGGIIGKSINVGQYINQGTTFAKIKNITSIKATIQLLQSDLQKVAIGQNVLLKLSESDETTYPSVIETISEAADNQTRAFDCLIKINNANGTLNSGISGYIDIPSKDKKSVLAVPTSAVTGSEGDYSVFTIKKGKAHRVPVSIGQISNNLIEITSGLQEGDKIIVTNTNILQDGDRVTASKGVK